jgi:hypothetical protein
MSGVVCNIHQFGARTQPCGVDPDAWPTLPEQRSAPSVHRTEDVE